MITPDERQRLRTKISDAYMDIQDAYKQGDANPAELLPELVAAFVSLAVYVGRKTGLSHDDLRKLMEAAIADEWMARP